MLAIGSDDQSSSGPKVFVYEYSESSRRWLRIDAFTAMTDLVHDIAFAPNLGRSFHVLAIASKELKVLALKPLSGPQLIPSKSSVVARAEESQSAVTKYDVSILLISFIANKIYIIIPFISPKISKMFKNNFFKFRFGWLANTMIMAPVYGGYVGMLQVQY